MYTHISFQDKQYAPTYVSTFWHVLHFTGHSKPTLSDLDAIVVPYVAATWDQIGIHLLGDSPKLDIIEKTYHGDPEKCCLKMLHHWLNVTPSATWDDLIKVLKSPHLALIAKSEEIESKIKGKINVKYVSMYLPI